MADCNTRLAEIIDDSAARNSLVQYYLPACASAGRAESTTIIGGTSWWTVPFVTKSDEFMQEAGRWVTQETWNLEGQILDCYGYEELLKKQQEIVDSFPADYGNLIVGRQTVGVESDNELKTLYYARLVSIDFGSSDYLSAVDYTITFEGYRNADSFETDAAVIDPVSDYDYNEEEDGTLTLTHRVSARGIQTASDPLVNAKNFVLAHIAASCSEEAIDPKVDGECQVPVLLDMKMNPTFKRYLESEVEEVNRFEGSYGLTRTYKATQTEDTYEVLRYTVTTDESIGETATTISFNGNIVLGYYLNPTSPDADDPVMSLGGNMALLRARYTAFKESKLIDPANNEFLTTIVSEDVTEDQLAGTLDFSVVCGTRDQICVKDYNVRVSETADTSLVTVSVDGRISAPGPCAWEYVSGCFYGADYQSMKWPSSPPVGTINRQYLKLQSVNAEMYNVALSGYNEFKSDHITDIGVHCPYPLNYFPVSYDITEDPINKTIDFSIEYNDRISWGSSKVDYTMNFTLPVKAIAVNTYVQEGYNRKDLGFAKHGTFNISLQVDGAADQIGGNTESFYEFASEKFIKNVDFIEREKEGMYTIANTYSSTESENKLKEYTFEWIWQQGGPQGYVNTACKQGGDCTEVNKLYFGRD